MRRCGWKAVVLVLVMAANGVAGDGLEARIGAVLKTPGFENGHWGLLVVDAGTGTTIFERNPDRMFCPASVTKLFSTAAALIDLGADFRFRTPVVRRGEVDSKGVLHGDLILVAKGDLALGGRTGPDGTLLFENHDHTYSDGDDKATLVPCDPLAGLDSLAREVLASGIKSVEGEVVVDAREFSLAMSSGSGPARVSPIVVNDNMVDIVVTPGPSPGTLATVRVVPATTILAIDARVETAMEGTRPAVSVRSVGPHRLSVRGTIPAGHRPLIRSQEVEDSASFARSLFIERLRDRGIQIIASPLADNPGDALPSKAEVEKLPKVAEYTSPPLPEYLKVILKVSHNLHASTLPLLIAAHHRETTLEQGIRREGAILAGLGVDPNAISFGGGAGGSRSDLVTPRATVDLIRSLMKRPDFDAIEAALPILGRDGTLAQAVGVDSPARGHVRAKTGTYWVENGLAGQALLTSKALAGLMETASGRRLVFAIFVNNVPLGPIVDASEATANAGKVLGKLCEAIYDDSPRSPTPGG